ncbi:MAG: hypothetical protein OXQ94_03860 [Gemmatimonadota bacterium]|nr:hypothetical protein [Gemmatimonadota bacterium]MDE2870810.1 hypothetical protein [Gemmatimonadota bacterium]
MKTKEAARAALMAIGFTVLLAGCGDDPVKPAATLTEAEAGALFKAMGTLGVLDDDAEPGASVDTTLACPGGGEARIVGSAKDRTSGDTIRLDIVTVVTPAGCVVTGDGRQFTVDGDPSVRIETNIEVVALRNSTLTGGVEGDVEWTLADRSGTCAIDLELDAAVDLSDPASPAVTGGWEGKLCGHDVKLPLTVVSGA